MSKKRVYGIRNAQGRWYTGNVVFGSAEFSAVKGLAIEMDAEEAATELASPAMPEGCESVVIYEYEGKSA